MASLNVIDYGSRLCINLSFLPIQLLNWYPAYFFEIIDLKLPSGWSFCYLGDNHPSEIMFKILGYQKIVLDDKNYLLTLVEVKFVGL
jgi:hypothetical protein